ncbi:MAG: zinc ribbon domain-containing protein [Methanobrevibacter sp.]|uniref:zinc-ribbon domain-containing protein n=1 Tax=Methanobrevibacter sp. TaxID=66852 RepID=UPI0025E7FA31|nr:zinc-ribbon domain-containing protein [Methanobrevibacter sp.]MBQ6099621.1 zinc ribbon domain-containing protein [Methanobrevibacter sp.]
MYCYECGENNPDNAKFCRNCGAPLKEEPKKVEVIETTPANNNTYQNSQTTSGTSSKDNSSTWIGCCLCLVGIFIIFAIMGMF